jgi:Na+-transporting methylmalonyl-CoA/oxaloacetate decarboxylase gamma subunit
MDSSVLIADLPSLIAGLLIILLVLGLLVGAMGMVGYFLLQFFKWRGREEHALEYVVLQVAVPRDNEVKIDAMEQLFSSLYTLYKGKANLLDFEFLKIQEHISFEIVGLPGDIRFYVSVPQKQKELVEKQIHGTYAGAVITEVEDYNIFSEKGEVAFASLKLKNSNYLPIKSFRDFAVDPMSQITSSLAKLSEGEGAVIQIVVSPANNKWRTLGRKFVSKTKKNEADPEKAKFNVDAKTLEAIEGVVGAAAANL